MKKVAKFDIKDLLPIAMTLVVLGIGVAYGLSVLRDVKDEMGDCSTTASVDNYNTSEGLCYNSTNESEPHVAPSGDAGVSWQTANNTIEGIAKLPSKLPLIVTIIVAAIIIGILLRYLMVRFG